MSLATISLGLIGGGILAMPSPAAAEAPPPEPVTLRPVAVANSGVSGEITFRPNQGSWRNGMLVKAVVTGVKLEELRDRHVIVTMFTAPSCPFDARLSHFGDLSDPVIEHFTVFEEGYWTREGSMFSEGGFPIGWTGSPKRWRGIDAPLGEQIKSVAIMGYTRTVPTFMGTILACANLDGSPVNVAVVSTTADEPPTAGSVTREDTTPFAVQLAPVGSSGVSAAMKFRPYEWRKNQPTWYRCYAQVTLQGTEGMEKAVRLFLYSEPNCTPHSSRLCLFYDQWRDIQDLPPVGEETLLNCFTSEGHETPPGAIGAGGWLADRSKMQSVGAYDLGTGTLLACANIPPPAQPSERAP